jgi:hypothetical protein
MHSALSHYVFFFEGIGGAKPLLIFIKRKQKLKRLQELRKRTLN